MSTSFSRVAHYAGCVLLVISAFAYLVWLPLGPIGPPLTDFSAYYAAGRYWSHGGDPYGVGIWSIEKTLPASTHRGSNCCRSSDRL